MIRRLAKAAGMLLGVLTLPETAAAETRIVDATGRTVIVQESGRIVAIGGAITEIVYSLGLSDRVVAVDSTSLYPKEATAKPNVGYMRQLGAEPVLSLDPSLVLAVEDAGPPAVLDQLREAGVPVVLVPDDPSPQGVLDKIAYVAEALDAAAKGKALQARLRAELETLSARIAGLSERPRVLFLLSVGGGAPLAGGRGTSAAGIIELAGGVNAAEAIEDFRPLSPEAAVAAAPDVILVTKRSLDLLGGKAALLERPEVALTPAGQSGNVVAMNGLLLLGFGPRTGTAIRQLAEHLHPGLNLDSADP